MPSRIIRDWTDSYEVERISVYAERLLVRLLMKVDDYGRQDGRLRIILSRCFPFLTEEISVNDLDGWLNELVDAGLLIRYEVGGDPFIELLGFDVPIRSKASQYPDPPIPRTYTIRYIDPDVRKEVLAAGVCAVCGATERLSVDHIKPVSKGGTSDRSNLQCLCVRCNSRKGTKHA